MGFSNWAKSTSKKANTFFTNARGHAKAGLHFLNNTILPGARKAHKTITDVSNVLQKDSNVSVKNKERLNKLSKLSDAGLQRLSDTSDTINRVASVV